MIYFRSLPFRKVRLTLRETWERMTETGKMERVVFNHINGSILVLMEE